MVSRCTSGLRSAFLSARCLKEGLRGGDDKAACSPVHGLASSPFSIQNCSVEIIQMPDYGLNTWSEGTDAVVDIVFVHGLRGHWQNTWSVNGIVWPKDYLANDIPESRLFSFGYDSAIWHSEPDKVTQGNLEYDAKSLCSQLQAERERTETSSRPIITVAHSLGGLVCAQMIISGDTAGERDSVRLISERITGMIFLGTPFGGSRTAGWGELLRKVVDTFSETDKKTLKNLKQGAPRLEMLRARFPEVIKNRSSGSGRVQIAYFFERYPTRGVLVVDEKDASYPNTGEIIPLPTNHSEICKFPSSDDPNYAQVKAKILEMMKGTSGVQESSASPVSYSFINNGKILNQPFGTNNFQHQTINLGSW